MADTVQPEHFIYRARPFCADFWTYPRSSHVRTERSGTIGNQRGHRRAVLPTVDILRVDEKTLLLLLLLLLVGAAEELGSDQKRRCERLQMGSDLFPPVDELFNVN